MSYEEVKGINIYGNSIPKKCYVSILIMVIIINMIGWLIEYTVHFAILHVSAVMLPNFWQKYMNAMSIYAMYMDIMHSRMFESKI